jgi:hypothetical protein
MAATRNYDSAMEEHRSLGPSATHSVPQSNQDGRDGDAMEGDPSGSCSAVLKLCRRIFTLQDGILLGYMLFVWGLIWRVGPGSVAATCALHFYVWISAVLLACFLSRAPTGISALPRSLAYRAGVAAALISNYLMLRDVLPLIRPESLDGQLLSLDVALFGVEPSLYLERLNQRPIVEWFSFFYFSYYGICLFYLVVVVWLSELGRPTTEFALGTVIVFCLGQLGYMAVPGYGPVKYLHDQFMGPIDGGLFWGWVRGTVEAGHLPVVAHGGASLVHALCFGAGQAGQAVAIRGGDNGVLFGKHHLLDDAFALALCC